MKWFKRISLFIVTNMLVLLTVSIAFSIISQVFGLNRMTGYMSYLIVFCAVWGMGGAFVSLLISKWMAKRFMGVQIIEASTPDPRLRELLSTVHELARRAGLTKMPEVGVFDSPEINAFATGPSRNNSMVAVSTGLLGTMNRDEIEGVLGHEVSHIANGDMVTMTLIQGIVNAFVLFFARILANLISSQVDEKLRGIVHLVLVITLDIAFAILGSLVVNYFSRQREFRADAGSANVAGRGKMIAGLRKLQAQYAYLPPENDGMATMKISAKSSGFKALFSTHPPLEERIKRLELSA